RFSRAQKIRVFPPHWNSHEEPFILSWHPFFLTPRKSRLGDGSSSHGIEVGGSLVNAEIGMLPKTLLTTRSRVSGMRAAQIRRRLQRWNLDPFIAPKRGSENTCVQ
ncbi:hypothetical protein V1477_018399, partial [Vespula maculifrons]